MACTYPSIHVKTLSRSPSVASSAYPSIHVETPSRSRSVVWCVLCVHVACVVCGLCVYMWCCVWCWWCVCVVKLGTLSLSLLFSSPSSSLPYLFLSYLSFSLFFFFFFFSCLLLLLLLLLSATTTENSSSAIVGKCEQGGKKK